MRVFHVKVQKFTIWSILAIFSYFSLIFIIRKMPRAELGFEKEGGFLVNVISRHLIPVKKSVLILAHLVFCLFKPIKPPPRGRAKLVVNMSTRFLDGLVYLEKV